MKVFVSSTYEDLKTHRTVVEASLRKSGYDFNGMEHFCADPKPSLKVCLNTVRRSDVFVGVIGMKYGQCPPGRKQSYTEREYRLARILHKPILMFLIDEQNARIAPQHFETDPRKVERLERFRTTVLKRHNIGRFTSEDNLAWQILASLRVVEIGTAEVSTR